MTIPNPISYRQWKHPKESDLTHPFNNIIMPLVRRVFANTIGLDLVAVQPMARPRGLLFYPDYLGYHDVLPPDFIARLPRPPSYLRWKELRKWEGVGLLGVRGHQMLDPGYVFAPYIPMMELPLTVARDFEPRAGIALRYQRLNVDRN